MALLNIIFIFILIALGCSAEYNNSMSRSYKGLKCMEDLECQELLGSKSSCLADECQCLPHYHINTRNVCVRDRGLKEFCQVHGDCYWGPEMVDKIECSLGVCSCVPGYVPDQGKICVKYFSSSGSNGQIFHLLIILAISTALVLP